jgi:hypothetical protein
MNNHGQYWAKFGVLRDIKVKNFLDGELAAAQPLSESSGGYANSTIGLDSPNFSQSNKDGPGIFNTSTCSSLSASGISTCLSPARGAARGFSPLHVRFCLYACHSEYVACYTVLPSSMWRLSQDYTWYPYNSVTESESNPGVSPRGLVR